MPDVKCSVASCSYHGRGNVCMAKEIMVEGEGESARSGSGIDQEIGGMAGSESPSSSPETCCGTFRPKE